MAACTAAFFYSELEFREELPRFEFVSELEFEPRFEFMFALPPDAFEFAFKYVVGEDIGLGVETTALVLALRRFPFAFPLFAVSEHADAITAAAITNIDSLLMCPPESIGFDGHAVCCPLRKTAN